MKPSARLAGYVWLLMLLLCAVSLGSAWRGERLLDLDLRALLPSAVSGDQAAVESFIQNFERQLVLALPLSAADQMPALVTAAEGSPLFSEVVAPDRLLETLRRELPWLLAPEDYAQRQTVSAAELLQESRGEALMGARLGAVFSLSEDPLGTANRYVDFLSEQFDGGEHLLVTVTLARSPFELEYQSQVVAWIAQRRAEAGELLASGVVLHAQLAAARARSEVQWLASASVVLVVLFAWLVFRGLRPLLFVLTVVAGAVLVGLTVSHWVLGRVHMMTLVFSAAVVGVTADYAYHFLVEGPTERFRRGLRLAVFSSALAFAALAVPSFPGLRQMGLLGVTGLFAGALGVFALRSWVQVPMATAFVDLVLPGRGGLRLAGLSALTVAVVLVASVALHFDDDVRRLSPSALAANSAEIWDPGLFVLLRGDSVEQVLQLEEELLARVWREGAAQKAFASALLEPSAARRSAVDAWRDALPKDAVAELLAEFGAPPVAERSAARDAESGADLFRLRRVEADTVISVMRLGDYDLPRLQKLLKDQPNARLVDPAGEVSAILTVYRKFCGYSLIGAWLLATALLSALLGRSGLSVGLISGIAVGGALVIAQWLSGALTLFHLLAGFLVLGLAIDYGVFLRGARRNVSVATSLAAASTVVTFGLLSFSATPVIASFGVVVLVGTAIAWLLALLRFAPHSQRPATGLA